MSYFSTVRLRDMKTFKFRFYLGKKIWERTFEATTLSQAWKMAHQEASEYPTKRFIEIANI